MVVEKKSKKFHIIRFFGDIWLSSLQREGQPYVFKTVFAQRGGDPLKLTKQEQDVVRRKFGKYCIKVLDGEMLNYLDELDRLREWEVNFSDLQAEIKNQLYCYDVFPETRYFHVMDMDVPVNDEEISAALCHLPEKKRMVILIAYFLDMTEKEIADCLNLV